ncbi:MAG: spore germination protein [Bacillota bacterium]|nr:spore germination protein [Bacillota bacterium]
MRRLAGCRSRRALPRARGGQATGERVTRGQPAPRVHAGEVSARPDRIPASLADVERWLRESLGSPPDLVIRTLPGGSGGRGAVLIAYLASLVPKELVATAVVKPLLAGGTGEDARPRGLVGRGGKLPLLPVGAGDVREASDGAEVLEEICRGRTAVFAEGAGMALLADTSGPRGRPVDEPTLEGTLRGPHDGFTENLDNNLAQIRRRLAHPSLRIALLRVGDLSRTRVAVIYLDGLARSDIVGEVMTRLGKIRLDGVVDTAYLEEHMVGTRLAVFPLALVTERPDRVVGNLLEGRLAVLADGTPAALVLPVTVSIMLQSADDYYLPPPVASLARILRFTGLLMTVLLPALYVALTAFHHELIPTTFFFRVAAGREGIPVSTLGEALLMGVAFELLREAGSRLPRQVGQAVSVVGAIVVGEAAIRASIISPLMLIVLSVTAITSFLVPFYTGGASLWVPRFAFTLLAGMFGLIGIGWGMMVGLYYLSPLRPLDTPYLAPIGPVIASDLKDFLTRVSWRGMARRPSEPGARRRFRKPPPGRGRPRRGR